VSDRAVSLSESGRLFQAAAEVAQINRRPRVVSWHQGMSSSPQRAKCRCFLMSWLAGRDCSTKTFKQSLSYEVISDQYGGMLQYEQNVYNLIPMW